MWHGILPRALWTPSYAELGALTTTEIVAAANAYTAKTYGQSADAIRIAGKFDRAGVVLGGDNEGVLRRVADPQIVSVYGADFRSTPVFFLMDDHDYFDNDDAFDEIITFPPSHFMLQLGRVAA